MLGVVQLGMVKRGDDAQLRRKSNGVGSLKTSSSSIPSSRVSSSMISGLMSSATSNRTEGRAAAQQFLLQCLQQVLCVVFFYFQIFIARDAEVMVLNDFHAREQEFQVYGNQRFERDEACGAQRRVRLPGAIDAVRSARWCPAPSGGQRVPCRSAGCAPPLPGSMTTQRCMGKGGPGLDGQGRSEHREDLGNKPLGEYLAL